MKRRETRFWRLWVLAILGAVLWGASGSMAAPQGVMKQAIHWGLSADWLDPATGSFGVSQHLTDHVSFP